MQALMVTVPAGVLPGQQFRVVAGAQEMMVTCPLHCGPGATVRIDVPAAAPQHPTPAPTPPAPQTSRAMQVTVPAGVVAGQSFRVQIAGGGDVMVACPPNCGPGSALRIEVPITQPTAGGGAAGAADTAKPESPAAEPGADFDFDAVYGRTDGDGDGDGGGDGGGSGSDNDGDRAKNMEATSTPGGRPPPGCNLFVKGLPYTHDKAKVKQLFSGCGEVAAVTMNQRGRGTARVDMGDPKGASTAIVTLDGFSLGRCKLGISMARAAFSAVPDSEDEEDLRLEKEFEAEDMGMGGMGWGDDDDGLGGMACPVSFSGRGSKTEREKERRKEERAGPMSVFCQICGQVGHFTQACELSHREHHEKVARGEVEPGAWIEERKAEKRRARAAKIAVREEARERERKEQEEQDAREAKARAARAQAQAQAKSEGGGAGGGEEGGGAGRGRGARGGRGGRMVSSKPAWMTSGSVDAALVKQAEDSHERKKEEETRREKEAADDLRRREEAEEKEKEKAKAKETGKEKGGEGEAEAEGKGKGKGKGKARGRGKRGEKRQSPGAEGAEGEEDGGGKRRQKTAGKGKAGEDGAGGAAGGATGGTGEGEWTAEQQQAYTRVYQQWVAEGSWQPEEEAIIVKLKGGGGGAAGGDGEAAAGGGGAADSTKKVAWADIARAVQSSGFTEPGILRTASACRERWFSKLEPSANAASQASVRAGSATWSEEHGCVVYTSHGTAKGAGGSGTG